MLFKGPKSLTDTIQNMLKEAKNPQFEVPEDIEKEGVAHFMGAAAAAHKSGQKKFNFGGKVYPVKIKPHIAKKVNEDEVKEQVKSDVENKFPASGVTKHAAPKPGSSTMPKDKEKRGPIPAGNSMKEGVEDLDELDKSTLASYAKKATHDARIKHGIGKDFERISKSSRKPEYKQSAKDWEDKYKSDARRREAGANKAIDRLAKEEVEIEEAKDTPGQSHQCALHVKSEQFGEGRTLFSQHAEPDENGDIAWYDVMFEHGIEKHVPTADLEIMVSESHMNHKKKMKEEVELDEGRGRPRKNPPKPASDDEDDYGPDTGPEPDQNIVQHLKKSVDTKGTHDVKFADGSSHKVPHHVASTVLGAMGKLKPADRLEVQNHIHQSHKNLMDVHRMIK